MAQLDKFIAVLYEKSADTLVIAEGARAALERAGTVHPLSPATLSGKQVTSVLREIAPPEHAAALAARTEVRFSYQAPAGAVAVHAHAEQAAYVARITPARSNGAAARAAPRATSASRPAAPQNAVGKLLADMLDAGASDLHLRVGQPPILRRDGRLERRPGPALAPDEVQALIESIIPERDRAAWTERGDADFAYELPGVARFRVNAATDRNGAMAVFRVVPSVIPTCDALEIPPAVRELGLLSKGLVVVTGPTGSGKSTTLAAIVDLMNRTREDHILTIEDPIEFVHESQRCLVTHRQVGLHTASFRTGLRAALREDPDIILIGELRDLETVAVAIETAETGHLVFGTLHTTTAASTVDRIIDQFPADRQSQIRVMLSESLRGVVAQTLCRRIGGGRVAAREILLQTPAVANLIREGKTFQLPSVMQTGRKQGMVTLNEALLELVTRKLVEPGEAYLKAVDKAAFAAQLQAAGYTTRGQAA